jgi:hypothetical protein
MIMTKPRRGFFSAEWTRTVQLSDGRVFYVSLTRGKRVRIPFKKRGQNVGYQWIGSVRSMPDGKELYRGQVPKNVSVRALLYEAYVEEFPLQSPKEAV